MKGEANRSAPSCHEAELAKRECKGPTDGMLWSTVTSVQSGRRTGRDALRLMTKDDVKDARERGQLLFSPPEACPRP